MSKSSGKRRREREVGERLRAMTDLGDLPQVNVSHRSKGHSFEELDHLWQNCRMTPLLVRATLTTDYVPHDGRGSVHLDSILWRAVLHDHPVSVKTPGPAFVLPLPLARAWVSPDGRPLWLSSDLRPEDDFEADIRHRHKRRPISKLHLVRKVPSNLKSGARKERRTPYRVGVNRILIAFAIGNAEAVRGLLERHASHVNKLTASGSGKVGLWEVEEIEADEDEFRALILASRPVPVRSGLAPGNSATPATWTPPYHHLPWSEQCRG